MGAAVAVASEVIVMRRRRRQRWRYGVDADVENGRRCAVEGTNKTDMVKNGGINGVDEHDAHLANKNSKIRRVSDARFYC